MKLSIKWFKFFHIFGIQNAYSFSFYILCSCIIFLNKCPDYSIRKNIACGEKKKKSKYTKFWIIFLEHFIKYKTLLSGAWIQLKTDFSGSDLRILLTFSLTLYESATFEMDSMAAIGL